MVSGIRINMDGGSVVLVPGYLTVVSAGRVTLPNTLEGDNTYGVDIALPMADVPLADLAVIIVPQSLHWDTLFTRWVDGATLIWDSHYANSAISYYTRNPATGVLTAWTAGARSAGSKVTWNPVFSVFPTAFWDRKGAATFNNVRLFGAMGHAVRDTINDTNLSLAGSASGSGGTAGVPADINDDDTNIAYSLTHYTTDQNTDNFGYTCEVELTAAKIITVVEIAQYYQLVNWWVYENWMVVKLALYYNSAWHDVLEMTIFAPQSPALRTNRVAAYWTGVTKIRMTMNGHIEGGDPNPFNNAGAQLHATTELRAWGPSQNDAAENKIVYSIGDKGVEEVDYLIAVKKYNP